MEVGIAIRRVLLGESIASVAAVYRQGLLDTVGLGVEEAAPSTFRKETLRFAGRVCRQLADRHAEASQVESALCEWVCQVEDYDAFDALLSAFPSFDGRDAILRRGKVLFPGPLTAHWEAG